MPLYDLNKRGKSKRLALASQRVQQANNYKSNNNKTEKKKREREREKKTESV